MFETCMFGCPPPPPDTPLWHSMFFHTQHARICFCPAPTRKGGELMEDNPLLNVPAPTWKASQRRAAAHTAHVLWPAPI